MAEIKRALTYGDVQAWLAEIRKLKPADVDLPALPLAEYYGLAAEAAEAAGWFAEDLPQPVREMPARDVLKLGKAVWERFREETAVDPN